MIKLSVNEIEKIVKKCKEEEREEMKLINEREKRINETIMCDANDRLELRLKEP